MLPSSYYVTEGSLVFKMGISKFDASATEEALVLLLFVRPDYCPLVFDLFFLLYVLEGI